MTLILVYALPETATPTPHPTFDTGGGLRRVLGTIEAPEGAAVVEAPSGGGERLRLKDAKGDWFYLDPAIATKAAHAGDFGLSWRRPDLSR